MRTLKNLLTTLAVICILLLTVIVMLATLYVSFWLLLAISIVLIAYGLFKGLQAKDVYDLPDNY